MLLLGIDKRVDKDQADNFLKGRIHDTLSTQTTTLHHDIVRAESDVSQKMLSSCSKKLNFDYPISVWLMFELNIVKALTNAQDIKWLQEKGQSERNLFVPLVSR